METTHQMWAGYRLTGFYDPAVPYANPLAGMKYNNFPIVQCSLGITLNQYPHVPLKDTVTLPNFNRIL